jgi:DNA repair protein RecN (Recombination protein N)
VLKLLTINDLAIIDELNLEFGLGFSVFTGETGAGKSITLDALGLILGNRSDSSIIRRGCKQAEVSAVFEVRDNAEIARILEEQAIELEENEIIIRRVIGSDGRSRAFINNKPVTAQLLRDLGALTLNIHGQHAHQLLGLKDNQRLLLDEYGEYKNELDTVANACKEWTDANRQLEKIKQGQGQDSTVNLLRYQVEEISALEIKEGEYEELDDEHRRLANGRRLQETTQSALNHLREDEQSISSSIYTLLANLRELESVDDGLVSINKLIDDAIIQINEASDELRSYLENLNIDPEHLQSVERRISTLHDIARKHNVKPKTLEQYFSELSERLIQIENNEELVVDLENKQAAALSLYRESAEVLHKQRAKAARKMQKEVTSQIQSLGMPDGQFTINIDKNELDTPRLKGMDNVEFMVCMNAGQSIQAMRKVASGGELSRISLAIQVVASDDKTGTSLVFDEIDAGIGGGVAEIVGKLLHQLSEKHQIICVTHLPQVASQADHHFQVIKISDKGNTSTSIRKLSKDERIDEIARMLGGVKITEKTRKHADEMLKISGDTA